LNGVDLGKFGDTIMGMAKIFVILLITIFLLVSGISFAQNYTAIAVTGFNQDLIAEGGYSQNRALNYTTAIFDGDNAYAGHVMYCTDFRGNYNQTSAPAGGLPVNRTITSANNSAIIYQLQPYNGNNVLLLNTANSVGTLTLTTPQSYQLLSILATSAEGTSTFTVRLNFNNSTYTDYSFTVPDWYNGTPFAIQNIGRVNARQYSTNSGERFDDIDGAGSGNNPRLYDCPITMTSGDMFKTLTSITFTKTVSGSRTAILAVCGLNPLSAPVATAGTNVILTGFRTNWNSVSNATKYRLDVSTISDFSSFVTGYSNKDVGNVVFSDVTGLSMGTYYYRVRAENTYGQSIHSNTITVGIAPATQATNITFTGTTHKSTTISWTRGSGTLCKVFLYAGSTGTPSPANGTDYTANANFGSGTQIGSTGWFCVYSGAGTSVNVRNLTGNITYRAMVMEVGSATSPAYNTTASTNVGNFTTNPGNQATNVAFSNLQTTNLTVNWQNGSAPKRCVFIKLGSTGTAPPADSTTYTASTEYGSGTQIGSTGWYCIYNGSASMNAGDLNITGLSQNTEYIIMVCEYFGNSSSEEYIVQSATLNPNTNQTPMPVKMMNFNFKIFEKNVSLKWSTASETNNAGFDVERVEVRSEKSEWREIGFVKGNGNSSTPTNYTYTDSKLNTGKYNYRLKQIDYNGNFEYHNLDQIVEVGVPKKFSLKQNYPNPFNPVTRISFDLPEDDVVNLSVYDLKGSKVKEIINERKQAGYYEVSFDGNGLSSGMYIVTLKNSLLKVSNKMLLLK
jgi:Secretion system C-terminal sorting domain